MSNEEIITHEEVKKRRELLEKGPGQAVKGFRTMSDAADFANKWRNIDENMIRAMYPKRTQGMGVWEVEQVRQEVVNKIRKKGYKGVANLLGGSLKGAQHVLKKGAMAVGGGPSKSGLGTSAAYLTKDILVDVFVYGTGPTGVPSFKEFVLHRQRKVFGDISPEKSEVQEVWHNLLQLIPGHK